MKFEAGYIMADLGEAGAYRTTFWVEILGQKIQKSHIFLDYSVLKKGS